MSNDTLLQSELLAHLEASGGAMTASELHDTLQFKGSKHRVAVALSSLNTQGAVERSRVSGSRAYSYKIKSRVKRGPAPEMTPLKLGWNHRRGAIQDAPSLSKERHVEQLRAANPLAHEVVPK